MGMYTEFIFGAELKKDTPKYIIEGLNRVINHYSVEDMVNIERANIITENGLQPEPIDFISPEAVKFIHEYDLYGLLYSSSYYFGCHEVVHSFKYDDICQTWSISTRSNCKNYRNRIEKFIDFIKPYILQGSGYPHNLFAYVQYEESEFPTLYGIDGKYDFNDPDRESAANKYLEKIYTTLYSFTNDYLKDFSVTDEILSQNNLTKDNYTHYDVLCICIKEVARRFNQGIDTTYKELQERYAELEEKYNKLEVKYAVLQRRYDNVTNSENEKSKIIQ